MVIDRWEVLQPKESLTMIYIDPAGGSLERQTFLTALRHNHPSMFPSLVRDASAPFEHQAPFNTEKYREDNQRKNNSMIGEAYQTQKVDS